MLRGCYLHSKKVRVDGHADDRVCAEFVQRIDLLLAANAAGNDELTLREAAQPPGGLERKAAEEAFAIDMRIEVRANVRLELRDRVVRRERNFGLPSFHRDAAVFGVDAGNEAIGADCLRE